LGVDGSLTPWAITAVGMMIANAIKVICFMQHLPTKNVGWSATVPLGFHDLGHRGTATSLPFLQTP
jgi:hypothetical protein